MRQLKLIILEKKAEVYDLSMEAQAHNVAIQKIQQKIDQINAEINEMLYKEQQAEIAGKAPEKTEDNG